MHCALMYFALLLFTPQSFSNDIEDDSFVSVADEEQAAESFGVPVPQIISVNNLLIVSTIDGRVSAVDPVTGSTVWSIATTGDLLVSSLSKLKVHSEGSDVRVVPSLDGHLFKFDGTKMQLLPLNIDKLLSNSHKLGENLFVMGRKEITSYGVNMQTGEHKYTCNVNGCERYGNVTESEDILVIERVTQTMRAINARNGSEEWYLSVGDFSLKLLKGSNADYLKTNKNVLVRGDELNLPPSGTKISVAMAEGSFGVIDSNTNNIFWSQTLPSPITNVWQVKEDTVIQFDLFDDENKLQEDTEFKPELLVGRYGESLYAKISDKTKLVPFPQQSTSYLALHPGKPESGLSLADVDNIYDKGVKFYKSDSGIIGNKTQCSANSSHHIVSCPLDFRKSIIILLLVVIISNAIVIFVVYLVKFRQTERSISNKMMDPRLNFVNLHDSNEPKNLDVNVETIQRIDESDASTSVDFSSRFMTDFEPTKCLGRGSFGVVFETRNKIDDCNYAIKRISLVKTVEIYLRVMREVKALAKLDHPGIIRYFNSWIEEPPLKWQEDQDQKWLNTLKGFKKWVDSSTGEEVLGLKNKYEKCKKSKNIFKPRKKQIQTFNPLKPFDDMLEFSSSDELQTSSSEESTTKSISYTQTNEPKVYLYIQMQLCKKKTLKEWLWIHNKKRDHKQMLSYFYQLTSAVQYVHSCGMIHRDLKPSNVFFAMDGSIKVGDFGLVCTMNENKIPCNESLVKHTSDIGTELYLSPEQVAHQPYNHKVDIYSLGMIFIELLCPFITQSERTKVLHNARKLVFSKSFEKQYPDECLFVSGLLSRTPARRPSAKKMIEDNLFHQFHS